MNQVTIRQIYGDELLTISRSLMAYAFRPSPPFPLMEEWKRPYLTQATIFALFSDDTAAACAAYSKMSQNIRGTLFPCSAVWGVATHPSARRHGYSRQVLKELLKHMHDASIPFSNLYPFRESFYDRLGYTTFPLPRTAHIPVSSFAPLLQKDLVGHVELVSISEGYSSHRAYLKQHQQKTHGMALFSDSSSTSPHKDTHWMATAFINAEPRGMMLYTIRGNGDNMEVPYFAYDDSPGKYLLLAWFARHIDQVKQVELLLPPSALPETWLPDLYFTIRAEEAPMARIITIVGISGMHCGHGRFSAQISDPICPWNKGNYLFESIDGILHVSHSDTAQCHLTIQGITSLVYGTHDPETFAMRGWGDPTPELQATMNTMFPPLLPYLYEKF
jgi:predicted acetyltransferase